MSQMRMGISLQQRQELKLKLAPQIIQSIEILQLPALELENLIKQEMEENPVLEVENGMAHEESLEAAAEEASEDEGDSELDELESEFERLEEMDAEWRDSFSSTSSWNSGEKDKKLEAMQNTAAKPASLQDYLFEQFTLLDLPEAIQDAGETIVYNIDDTGYLAYPLDQIFQASEPPVPEEVAEEALRVVQELEPPGVGARSLEECLLIQLDEEDEVERRIIQDHWENLKKNRLPKIAKKLGEDIETVKEAIRRIGSLTPRPGMVYSSEAPTYVTPDVIVRRVDGSYEVRLEDDWIPRIHISKRYRKMLQEQKDDEAVREYIKKKLESAKWLIDSIEQRQNTLLTISREIVSYQEEFLEKGIDYLRPLKMQEIADRVDVHVSTVSRAIRDKYMQSPRGIFALKYFFTGGTTTHDGEAESVRTVKHKVRDIIEQEDKKNPLSDQKIANKLEEVHGLDIARRTVTKYRKQLGLLSSRQRREY